MFFFCDLFFFFLLFNFISSSCVLFCFSLFFTLLFTLLLAGKSIAISLDGETSLAL